MKLENTINKLFIKFIHMKKILLLALVSVFVLSCNSDKKSQLEKLKKEHEKISQEISSLEKEIAKEEGKEKEKVVEVSVLSLKKTSFDHYLEVQGKIDGEENVAVSAKMMGVVTAIFAQEGQEVTKGQVLAQLDDAVLTQSMVALDSTLVFATA